MDEKAKSVKEKLIAKYDKRELSPEKKAVLESWVEDVNRLDEKHGLTTAHEKERELVLKLAKRIEEREKKAKK